MSISAVGSSMTSWASQYQAMRQTQQASQGQFPDPSQLDADGDGALSLEESGLEEEQFNSMDTDGDGLLTKADKPQGPPPEMMGMQGMMGAPPPPSVEDIMSNEDTDGDDQISAEESLLDSEMFNQIDSDSDGYLTESELESIFSQGRQEAQSSSSQSSYAMTAYQTQAQAWQQMGSEWMTQAVSSGLNLTA